MHSPRTEGGTGAARRLVPRGGLRGFLQRLNTRLVVAIATVSLVSLLVSAIAISQILPGYFAQQAEERLDTAMNSTIILLNEVASGLAEQNDAALIVAERREREVYQYTASFVARLIIPATVEIIDEDGQRAAFAQPVDVAERFGPGLRPDAIAGEARRELILAMPAGLDDLPLEIVIRDPYTNREATLDQLRSAVVGAGILALLASVILGVLAAGQVTAPIERLRRVAADVGRGRLDERASASGVREVDELAAQFNVMADRLAGSLRMLEADRDQLRAFVADVSHELRTPIAALRMYTELQRDGEVDEATRVEFLERSTDQIRRLEWMSTNLLDLSRIDAGIFPLDVREGDLRDPIRSVVEAQAEVAERRGISLRSEVPSAPMVQRFDRERVVQLLTNLVGNALKFTPGGGEATIRLTEAPDGARIEVSDNGPGIRADELPRVFERFYRGTNTGEARASGSGLGLAIVRSIVEMHGGTIEVASVLGEGTIFTIDLPRPGPAASDSGAPVTAEAQ